MTKTEFMLIGSRQKLSSLAVLPALEVNEWHTIKQSQFYQVTWCIN